MKKSTTMKATVNRRAFAEALSAVVPAIPARSNSTILKSIKMVVGSDGIALMATDQEVGIRYLFDGNIADYQPGTILLPPDRVMSVVREATAETITISNQDHALRIESLSNWWNLSTADVSEFPDVAPATDGDSLEVPAADLRTAIERTLFASDDTDTRYALGGVCFDLKGGELTLAATDSRRLAVVPVQAEGGGQDRREIIPKRALKLLQHVLRGNDETAKLTFRKSDAVLEFGPATITCRFVQGRFPNFTDVIPRDCSMLVNLPVDRLGRAIRQTMAVTDKERSGIDFRFQPGCLSVHGEGEEAGLADVRIDVECDQKLGITFDGRFVVEFLKHLDQNGQVTMRADGPNNAVLFEADDQYRYVIMPLASE